MNGHDTFGLLKSENDIMEAFNSRLLTGVTSVAFRNRLKKKRKQRNVTSEFSSTLREQALDMKRDGTLLKC